MMLLLLGAAVLLRTRRPYNLYCVGADVKPCSINQSMFLRIESRNGLPWSLWQPLHYLLYINCSPLQKCITWLSLPLCMMVKSISWW